METGKRVLTVQYDGKKTVKMAYHDGDAKDPMFHSKLTVAGPLDGGEHAMMDRFLLYAKAFAETMKQDLADGEPQPENNIKH